MGYVFKQSAGNGRRSGFYNITAFGAGGVVTHASMGAGNNAPGQTIIISSHPTKNGHYTSVQALSNTQTRLHPDPGTGAVSGAKIQYIFGFTPKVTAKTVTSFTPPDTITVSGFDWVANDVQKNDAAFVSAGVNRARWYVDADPATTPSGSLVVRPINGSATIASGALSGATVTIRAGRHEIHVTDVPNPSFTDAFASGTMGSFSSGTPSDFLISGLSELDIGATSHGQRMKVFPILGIGGILISTTSGGTTNWASENEMVLNCTLVSEGIWVNHANVTAGPGEWRVGALVSGSDIRSATKSSIHIGIGYDSVKDLEGTGPDRLKPKTYGSFVAAGRENAVGYHGRGTVVAGSLFGSRLMAPLSYGGGTAEIDTAVVVGDQPWQAFLGGAVTRNILNTDSPSPGFLLFATTTQEGLTKSSACANPLYTLFDANVTMLNPGEEYTSVELFDNATYKNSQGFVKYTWNPTFVERDRSGGAGVPISGLTVRVFNVIESSGQQGEISGSPFTTDANGQLNAGAGIDLQRWWALVFFGSPIDVSYRHRIVVEGPNYRAQDFQITMRQKLVYDHPVDVSQTDFESELST